MDETSGTWCGRAGFAVAVIVGLIGLGVMPVAAAGPCGPERSVPTDSGLYPLPEEGRWGFVDREGRWRIAPQWRQARPFSEGRAAVQNKNGWGVIDTAGDWIVKPGAVDADAWIVDGQRYPLSPYRPASEGCIAATPAGGQAHFLTLDGQRWDPPGLADEQIVDLGSYSEGYARVRVVRDDEEVVGWIDTEGQWALAPEYRDGGDFAEGRVAVWFLPEEGVSEEWANTERWFYMDADGVKLFPGKHAYDRAGSHSNGIAPIIAGGRAGFIREDRDEWVFNTFTIGTGSSRDIAAAGPFSEGRAPVLDSSSTRPVPVWVDTEGEARFVPTLHARYFVCHSGPLPQYTQGLVPLVVTGRTPFCGGRIDMTADGPGDPRTRPNAPVWAMGHPDNKLVWVDRDGNEVIDSTSCRAPFGVEEPSATRTEDGRLTAGGFQLRLEGSLTGAFGPEHADVHCGGATFSPVDSLASNTHGPWGLDFHGEAFWEDKPIGLRVDVQLPAGLGVGEHPVVDSYDDDQVTAYLWPYVKDRRSIDDPRPGTYRAQAGTLRVERLDEGGISGSLEMTLANWETGASTRLTVDFQDIPLDPQPELTGVEIAGNIADLIERLPSDDPVARFFLPIDAASDGKTLRLGFGASGLKVEVLVPAGFSGAFTADPDQETLLLDGQAMPGQGTLQRDDGLLSGTINLHVRNHSRFPGEGQLTLEFARLPIGEVP